MEVNQQGKLKVEEGVAEGSVAEVMSLSDKCHIRFSLTSTAENQSTILDASSDLAESIEDLIRGPADDSLERLVFSST